MEQNFYITADMKYSFQDEYETAFAGYDIESSYSTGYPCWLQGSIQGRGIKVFDTCEEARDWFDKHKEFLLRRNTKLKNIRIVKMTFEDIEML